MKSQFTCLAGFALFVLVMVLPGATVQADDLEKGFRRPPRQYSMVPFWSWNGRLDPQQLRWQIDQMVQKGVYGAFVHAREGLDLDVTPYFSEGWWEAVRASVEHGSRVGFSPWIYDEDKWPSGSAGGRTLQKNPERNCRKGFRLVQQRVRGPGRQEVGIPDAVHVVAGRLTGENGLDPASLIDITRFNTGKRRDAQAEFSKGLRAAVVSDYRRSQLAANCKELGCDVVAFSSADSTRLALAQLDIVVSDVRTEGTGLDREVLLSWIRQGGGYVDFSSGEGLGHLYELAAATERAAPGRQWLLPDHPVAAVPNRNPEAVSEERRWPEPRWRGGADFGGFDSVLADRQDPPGSIILARQEGKGRVVYCGTTRPCRERGAHLELLQNILLYASGRAAHVARKTGQEEEGAPGWACPEGEWLVTGYVPEQSGGVNYLNRDTVRDFMDITHEEYAKRVGQHFAKAIPGVFFDEIHNHGPQIVWAEGFEERFRELKGYDLVPLLPALTADIGPTTPKVRCDYYDVYTTLYEEAWFKQISGWCRDHGLELTGHTEEGLGGYRTQGDYFRTMRHLHIPGTDNEDFRYSWPRVIDPWKPKQLSSVAHLYGRPRAGVEAMGGAGWSFTLDSARYGFNMLAAYGINFFVPHLLHYAQDRPENVDDYPPSWFFQNPYWKYFKTFADYSSRLSYMLTGGRHAVDVAVLYPQTNLWAGYGGGTTVPTVGMLVANQIDADLIDPDSLVRAKIADGALLVGDMRYRVLLLPAIRCVHRGAADQIVRFIRAGGMVLVHDRWPADSMEAGRDDAYLAEWRRVAEEKGLRPTKLEDTVALVSKAIDRDVIVTGEGEESLRYHHVTRGEWEVYWLANGSRKAGIWTVSFRAVGAPSLWQPEDGSITPVQPAVRGKERTECRIELDGWQGCFVVVDRKAGVGEQLSKPAAPAAPRDQHLTIPLDGPWGFLPVGSLLDYDWRVDVDAAELELPVMRVQWERGTDPLPCEWQQAKLDDARWRRVKILDTLHRAEGAERYRSRWRARFISFYDFLPFKPVMGGKGFRCRTDLELAAGTGRGWLAVICENPYRATIGDRVVAAGKGGRNPERFDLAALPTGKTEIMIEADGASAILAEGELETVNGPVPIFTDFTWRVSLDGLDWREAWEFIAPPERPCGEPVYAQDLPMPHVVWYRGDLPPGVEAIRRPTVQGEWQMWADGVPSTFKDDWAGPMAGARVLAIRVVLSDKDHGLMEPVTVRCRLALLPLASWTSCNLDWYSGRAIYTRRFELSAESLKNGPRWRLDLGKVCYCAEIWVNGRLAGTRIWPPYVIDITEYLQPGENTLNIVVANLLANRMLWDIFDDVKASATNRKWHDGNIRRDGWCLESGLIGPVRLEARNE